MHKYDSAVLSFPQDTENWLTGLGRLCADDALP